MKKRKQDIIVVVNVKKLILFFVTVALCVLAVISCIQLAKRFARVGRFEVSEVTYYESEDIINACGVKLGDYLYALDPDAIEQRLLGECPFLLSVEVERNFPNRLYLNVTERSIPWYIEISGARYALDQDLLVIDELSDCEGMAKLILPNVRRVIGGSVPEFAESETELKKTLEVISAIRSTDFHKRLTEVDLSSRWDIRLTVDGKFTVSMGDMSQFSAKLDAVRDVLNSDRLDGAESGEIYAANPSQGVAVSVKMPTSVPEDTRETA